MRALTYFTAYANPWLGLDRRAIPPPVFTALPILAQVFFNLGKNESSSLNRNCDRLGFMKALVTFFSFLFPRMQASYYFLTRGSQANAVSKRLFRQERERGPATVRVWGIAASEPGFAPPVVFWTGNQALPLTSRRLNTPGRSTSDSMDRNIEGIRK